MSEFRRHRQRRALEFKHGLELHLFGPRVLRRKSETVLQKVQHRPVHFFLQIDILSEKMGDVTIAEKFIDKYFAKKEWMLAHKPGQWIKGADDE